MRFFLVGVAFFAFHGSGIPLAADTVVLVDGNEIRNVRVIYQAGRVNLVRDDGGIQSYRQAEVREVRREPVVWQTELNEAEFEEQTRGRIAEVVTRIRAEETRKSDREQRHRLGVGVRATLLPGWDKLHRGETRIGLAVMGVGVLSAYYFLDRSENFARVRDDYNDLFLPTLSFAGLSASDALVDLFLPLNYVLFAQRRADLRSAARELDFAAIFVFAVWLANLTEALITAWAFDASAEDFHVQPDRAPEIDKGPEPAPIPRWRFAGGADPKAAIRFAYTEAF